MKIFAIKDTASESFNLPFYTRTPGAANRMFLDEANNPESQINKHPNDYELYYLGEYSEITGAITATMPERIARASDIINKE